MNDGFLMAGPCARGSPSRTIEVRSIALNALPFPPVSRVLLLALSLVPSAITAQTRPASSPSAAARPDTPSGAVVPMNGPLDTTQFAALKWREIGPYRGGRSVAVAGSVKRSNEYWMGTTGGGVFKSTDAGMTWLPVTDKYFGGTIGAIAVAPSNPDIVYVGTGEYPIRGNVSHGDGVYKTVDGGKTWTFLGLKETRQISRVRVHPTNPDIVYVGAQGHVWGPNADRGVFRSRDGGKSWQKVLFRNDSTGVSDLVMDPANPNTLYAAFWQAGRTPWLLVSGGPGSGIFKTENGGDTWRNITRNVGLPKGLLGNIGITVSGAKPSRVWAIIEAEDGGVFRSEDGGSSWIRTNDERKLRQRAWYYSKIHADPTDSNVVYVNNVAFNKSTDGGKTFRTVRVPHADSHDLWIAPNDNQRMIEGDDGGASVSVNGGKSWSDEDYATAQFYHVTTTNHFPYRVCGAQQDNSTLCGPSRKEGAIDLRDWDDAGGGESGYIAARTDDPDIVYAGSYGGHLTRKDLRTGIERDINPWPDNPMGHSASDLKYRFQWTYPIVLSPHDPNALYAASNVLFRSTNEGQTWTPISGDLTRHDARTLGPSGGPITKDQTSVEYYATIFTVAESPMQKGVIWTGSDDGLIHLTRDAGKSWTNVTPPQLTAFTRISMIEPSRHTPGGAYVAANRYQLDDMQPYIWRTSDYGRTWKRVDDDIAAEEFVRVVREDPERKGLLYAGTERGVWVSFDDGQNWQRLQLNLPPVPVHDLAVKEGDLVAGTHGRSFYILDDLSVLRQATPAVAKKPAHLFKPRRVWRVTWGGGGGGGGGGGATNAAVHPRGANPPSGAVVYYTLDKGGHEVVLDFMDVRGTLIKRFTSKQDSATASDSLKAAGVRQARLDSLRQAGADTTKALEAKGEETTQEDEGPRRAPRPPRVANKAGLNMFVWNLRYADASTFDDMILWAGGTQGPVAPPATYRVRMKVNGTEIATDTFVVRKDPRSRATMADLREQIAFLLKIRDRVSEANDAVKQIRAIKRQLDDRESKATGTSGVSTTVLVRALRETLSMVEDSLYQTKNKSGQDPLNYPIRLNNKLSALSGVVAGTDARPTDQSYGVFNTLSAQLDRELMTMTRALDSLLPKLNVALQQIGLAAIEPKTQPVAGSR